MNKGWCSTVFSVVRNIIWILDLKNDPPPTPMVWVKRVEQTKRWLRLVWNDKNTRRQRSNRTMCGRCISKIIPVSFLRHTACAKDPTCVTTQQSTSNKHEHVFMATNIPVQVLSFLRSNRSNLSFHPVWIHQDHLYQWLRLFSLKLPTGYRFVLIRPAPPRLRSHPAVDNIAATWWPPLRWQIWKGDGRKPG